MLELGPCLKQGVTTKDLAQPIHVGNLGFDKHDQASVILSAPGLQCDDHEVFGRHHPRRQSIGLPRDRFPYRLSQERIARSEELHRPTFDLNRFTCRLITQRRASSVNRSESENERRGLEENEYVHIHRRHRLQVERRSDGARDRIQSDDTIGVKSFDD